MSVPTDKTAERLLPRNWRIIFFTAISFSFVFNLLRLTGPLFIVLVHDHVLASQSKENLVELFMLVVFFLFVMGIVDYARRRILARLGAQFQERFEEHIFDLTARQNFFLPGLRKPVTGLNEIDNLRGFFHSESLIALLDVIWAPMFLIVVFYFHWMLGWTVVLGLLGLSVLSLLRNSFGNDRKNHSRAARYKLSGMKEMILMSRKTIRSQDMSPGFNKRWLLARQSSRNKSIELSDWNSWFTIFSRQIRILLQYSVLAMGAYLVLNGELSIGVMVASMFLSVRVFSPVGQIIKEWPSVKRAALNWKSLKQKIISKNNIVTVKKKHPEYPETNLTLRAVNVKSKLTGALLLKSIDLTIKPGTVVEIIGTLSSGKSVLAETILGIFPRASGRILYGSTSISELTSEQAQNMIGYLPESTALIHGTIEENIACLAACPNKKKVLKAANLAQIHEMVTSLPEGYKTMIDHTNNCFSSGQEYQIALARALYYEPNILLIDEPNIYLRENHGKNLKELLKNIQAIGGSAIILSCEKLPFLNPDCRFILENGSLIQKGSERMS